MRVGSGSLFFSDGYKTDEFGCQSSCECGMSRTFGDMKFDSDKSVITAKNGQSNFVPENFEPWDDIHRDGKYLIPYKVHEKIAKNYRAEEALNKAFEKLESNSSLKFIERTDEERYLFFSDGYGCHSFIGQQKNIGPQDITLGPGCYYYFIVIHEVTCASKVRP